MWVCMCINVSITLIVCWCTWGGRTMQSLPNCTHQLTEKSPVCWMLIELNMSCVSVLAASLSVHCVVLWYSLSWLCDTTKTDPYHASIIKWACSFGNNYSSITNSFHHNGFKHTADLNLSVRLNLNFFPFSFTTWRQQTKLKILYLPYLNFIKLSWWNTGALREKLLICNVASYGSTLGSTSLRMVLNIYLPCLY